jgi:hypothetical protein
VSRTFKIALVVVGLIVLGIIVGTAAGNVMQKRRMAELKAKFEEKHPPIVAPESNASNRKDALTTPPTGDKKAAPTTSAPATGERHFAFVKSVSGTADDAQIKLDYAKYYVDDEARAAAKAAGDKVHWPGNYYVSNPTDKLRTLKIDPNATFVVVFGSPENRPKLTAAEFIDAVQRNADGTADAGFWFTVDGDTVTGGEEQWMP